MQTYRPFRFGLLTGGIASRTAWLEKAKQVEDLGYSTLLVDDHLYNTFAPFTALMSAASATTTLRLGSFVFGNDFRHPVILAKEAATLDVLSNGRFELGLGTGYLRSDYEQSGLALQSPSNRVSRLEEAIHIIKGLFAEEALTYTGNYFTIRDLNGLPKPAQKPLLPLLLGGGSKRILSIAAREANIVSVNARTTAEGGFDPTSMTPEATDEKIAWIREAAGDRFDELELNCLIHLVVTDQRRKTVEDLLQQWGEPADDKSIDDMLTSPQCAFGTVEELIDDLQIRRQRYGFSYFAISEYFQADALQQFAPVIAKLAGM